nr:hypothetical protein [Tanacetum cinerariifolium]
MDSMIPIGQKNTLGEYTILYADNRPPMLDKDLYDSWKSRMELYMQNRERRRMILELVEHEKIQADCDLKATNIILQDPPSDIYSLVNRHRIDSGLAVPVFKQGDDLIDAINKMMSFLSIVFLSTNNQLRNSSNPRQQATIHDGGVTVQPVQGRQTSFVADLGVAEGPITQTVITHNAAYQEEDLDAYDYDFDNFSPAKAVLLDNLSSYGSYVLSENEIRSDSNIIPYSEYLLETQNAAVHDTNSSPQQDAMILSVSEQLSNQVTNCNKVNKNNIIANKSLYVELERYKEQVKLLEERQNVDLSTREKLIMDDILQEKNAQFTDFEKQINYPKQTLSKQSKKKESLTKTFNVFKNKSKENEAKNIDKEITLEKKVKELDNIVYKMGQSAQTIRSMLYDGSVIAKETNVISIADSEETLMLEEENFGKCFVPQQELSDEQAFQLQTLHPNTDQYVSLPVKIEAPRELSKKKGFVITTLKNDLRKFKGKDIVDNASQASNAITIAPGMYKLDLVTLAPKDKNNRKTYIYYLKYTIEQAAILKEIFEQAKSLNPLDSASYYAFAITPINKKKTVRFAEPIISSSASQKQLDSSQTKTKQTSNNSVSTSRGVRRSIKSSRSKSTDNTKNDRILKISSSTRRRIK